MIWLQRLAFIIWWPVAALLVLPAALVMGPAMFIMTLEPAIFVSLWKDMIYPLLMDWPR
jgi:hypothetical protein